MRKRLIAMLLVVASMCSLLILPSNAIDASMNIEATDEVTASQTRSTDGIYLTTTSVNLRASAGTSGKWICTLSKITSVYYAGNDSKVADGMLWLHVTVYSGSFVGKTGWVANRYLTKIG